MPTYAVLSSLDFLKSGAKLSARAASEHTSTRQHRHGRRTKIRYDPVAVFGILYKSVSHSAEDTELNITLVKASENQHRLTDEV
jgi:hypothetical protein